MFDLKRFDLQNTIGKIKKVILFFLIPIENLSLCTTFKYCIILLLSTYNANRTPFILYRLTPQQYALVRDIDVCFITKVKLGFIHNFLNLIKGSSIFQIG